MNAELFKAILAMDAYNRGYGQGIQLTGTQIGNATIGKDSTQTPATNGGESVGFYAVSYTLGGQTIISYRGTDVPMAPDVINGWIAGVPLLFTPGNQVPLATAFYRAVLGSADPYTANVSFTGHSLGGGLAGLVASFFSQSATIFDNMPFELATANAYALWGLAGSPLPSVAGITAYATVGEILASARLGIQFPPPVDLPSYGGPRSPIDLHSQGLLVNLLYANQNGFTDWHNIGTSFIDALFDQNVAKAAGADSLSGVKIDTKQDYADVLRQAIAYSAIDGKEKDANGIPATTIFGDTGIRALFNDANEWGKVLKANAAPSLINDLAASVSDVFVQFAGKLAIDKVLQSAAPAAIDGVLKLSGSSLDIEFGNKLWGTTSNIVGHAELLNNIFYGRYSSEIKNVDTSMQALWGTTSKSIFQDVILGTSSRSSTVSVSDTPATGKADLFVGNLGGDGITGSSGNDLLLGYDGNDSLSGGSGNDILWGGPGNDSLSGGTGNDKFVINDGDGWDTIYYGQQGDRIVFNGTTLQGTATYQGNGVYSLLGYKVWQHGYSLEITSPDGKTSMEAQQFFTSSNGVYFDTTNMGITVPGIIHTTGVVKTYTGTEKDDFLNIVGGPNIVNGLGGNDKIYVYYYSSTIDGGAGNDYISGSSDTDNLNGGIGDDVILSNGGFDTVHGGAGNDLIYSGGGGQKIFGDAGFDIVDYASSAAGVEVNLALTTPQEGWTYNYAYDDILSGIEGVNGTNWADTLIGNSENNILNGRHGADTLTGGGGADVFKYNHPTSTGFDSGTTATTRDVITDFVNNSDKIDLSDYAGAFTFIGKSSFTGISNQVDYAQVAGDTIISLDTDGNRAPDMQIELVGLHTMTATDFVL